MPPKYTSDMARVGIVVPTRGERLAWLQECLESLSAQEGVDLEVVVVGPPGLRDRVQSSDTGIKFLEDNGGGLSAAINQGTSSLSSDRDYISWLGDDDLLTTGSLSAVSKALDAHPRWSFCYGQVSYIDSNGEFLSYARPTRFAPRWARIGKNFIPQPGCLFRATAVPTPLVDVNLHNSMDLDLFLRMAQCGGWGYVKRPVAQYRLHSSSITVTKTSEVDEAKTVRRRYGAPPRWLQTVIPMVDRIISAIQWRLPAPQTRQLPRRKW